MTERRGKVAGIVAAGTLLVVALAGCGGGKGDGLTAAERASRMALASAISSSAAANAAARSAPPTAPVEAGTRTAADRLCTSVLDYNAKHPNPYPTFDYNNPDVPTLRKLGAYFAASPFAAATGQIVQLPVPQQNSETWKAFTTQLDQLRQQSLTQIGAALSGDATAFRATYTPLQANQQKVSDAAHQVGFAPSESCYQLLHVEL